MLFAYRSENGKLVQVSPDSGLDQAIWLDLCKATRWEEAYVLPFVPEIPSLADMEEIEISARLYREPGFDFMTILVPGLTDDKSPFTGPVTFILGAGHLVTVRHHEPRPFETYAARADKMGLGADRPERVFLGLSEEIIGRLADLMEGAGRALDTITHSVFEPAQMGPTAELLQASLENAGRQGDLVSHCRLSLLTLERALGFFLLSMEERRTADTVRPAVAGLLRDIQSLEVHGDYLSNRVAQATDATLGMINLAQNTTVRIVSVVAVLFLPPTLIASVYGMNFQLMPELAWVAGYPMAIGLMVASAAVTYLVFKWKKWL
ncbi:MAG: magnesium transporter CorA family protein [Alphaproteobacteria bacterium]